MRAGGGREGGMRFVLLGFVLGAELLGWAGPSAKAEPVALPLGDPIDAMLAEFRLTRETLGPDPTGVLLKSGRVLAAPMTTRLLLHPLDGPYVAGHLAAHYQHWSFSIVRMLLSAVSQTPADISRGYLGNPLRESDERLVQAADPLVAGLEAVWEVAGSGKISTETRASWQQASREVPPEWRREVGRLLMASASAARWQNKAFEPVPEGIREALRHSPESTGRAMVQTAGDAEDLRLAVQKVDFEYLYAGALDLAAAAEDFEDFLHSSPPAVETPMEIDTPLGRVVLRGTHANDQYGTATLTPYLVLVDLGGNDTYGPGIRGAGMDHPVQMIFDAEGNDLYRGADTGGAGWGGAVGGYALLLDGGGNDTYQGGAGTQGAGILGVGMLIDRAGNDTYASLAQAQGYGYAGIGILQDGAGDDRYESVTRAQGCGECLGAGILLDEAGNDHYVLNDEEVVLPSPQTDKHNSSMGQGMGLGYRADLTDGHSIPGGVGVLYDRAGDDTYSAGVFAQGCGYLGGTGLLIDDAGVDTRKGAYYVQGASAHRGVGVVIDREGNDVYEAALQCAQGLGHDLGVGWLVDLAGNDRYRALRLAQGAANENGWGFCVDRSGDDSYELTAPGEMADALGAAKLTKWGTLREDMPALGLFLDAGGHDGYQGVSQARDNARWTFGSHDPAHAFRSEQGIGWDGEFPHVNLPTGPLTPFPQEEFTLYAAQQVLRRQYRGKTTR